MTGKSPLDKKIQTFKQKIHFCTTKSDEEAIARLFFKAIQNHLIPDLRDPLPWCCKVLGRENTEHAMKALATWPCPVCKKGFEQCDLCDGSGWSGPDMLCETCIGLGVVPCQFCGGSGLSTLESIPDTLKSTVIGIRVRMAAKHIKIFQGRINNSDRKSDTLESTKKPSETLLILNKLLSRLEDCIDETKQIKPVHPRHRFLAAKISTECVKAGLGGKRLMAQVLQEMIMAQESRLKDSQTNESTRTRSKLCIEFYQTLVNSDLRFRGTLLEHPILDRAIERHKNHTDYETARNQNDQLFRSKGKPRAAA